ncbi:hypothetical protein L4J17_09725 [Proteus mirabilis]|uniref:hypothetical protein n=1 Tax=Proteus mirabilis TaxID=584 RepID=UPI001A34C862|nr:hypothetical protein [Proteus mirabilis]ELW9236061.1 hypothetical protein [Proteus mirabilis]MBI6449076.1 hypothetical protein [Proteus mirabilis]MCW9728314.1 hypothetical protein [Proteus mirabilis]MDM3650742.1 hypothetical protein [Proteus mirabilis]MDS0820418.1 hypothetical protein [Proteus mirabilis]
MKERGIIFNSEMVRAILDGRKKQTRRVMNNQPCTLPEETISVQQDDFNFRWAGDLHNDTSGWFTCPLGKVGDRLWVRETWSVVSHEFDDDGLMIDYVPDRPTKAVHEMPYGHGYFTGHVIYSADGDFTWGDDDGCIDGRSCWKPSIHMPHWASRIKLEITDVRVERLKDAGDTEFKAEGYPLERELTGGSMDPFCWFRNLWDSVSPTNFKYADNPWVWVIEFKRI